MVRSQVYRVLSVIVKRGWFEESAEQKSSFFSQLMSALTGTDVHVRTVALGIWNSLIDEFSFRGASVLGMSLEFHEQCRFSFQENCLLPLYGAVLQLVTAVFSAPRNSSPNVEYVASFVSLLSGILQWDFLESATKAAYLRMREKASYASASTALSLNAIVRPPPSWKDVFVNSGSVQVLWASHELLLRSHHRASEGAAHLVREAIYQLCAVRDDFFSPPEADSFGMMYAQLGLALLSEFFQSCFSKDRQASVNDPDILGSLMYDACLILRKVFSNFPLTMKLSEILPVFADYSVKLVEIRLAEEDLGGIVADLEESIVGDSLELILEAWAQIVSRQTNLRYQMQRSPPNEELFLHLSSVLPTFCGSIAKSFWMMQLKLGRRELLEILGVSPGKPSGSGRKDGRNEGGRAGEVKDDEEDAEEFLIEERLSSVSILARLDPQGSFSWLDGAFEQTFATLIHFSQSRTDDATELTLAQEDLYWCIMFAGHLFADDCEGETPCIPDTFVPWAAQVRMSDEAVRTCPLLSVFLRIKNLAEWEFQGQLGKILQSSFSYEPNVPPNTFIASYISPRISESLSWFFSRWIPTYLHLDFADLVMSAGVTQEILRTSVLTIFASESRFAYSVLQCVLSRLLYCVQVMPMEPAIMDAECSLMHRCASHSSIARAMITMPLFWTVVDNVSSSILSLTLDVQRQLYRSFVEMCSSSTSVDQTQEALQRCLQPLHQLLESSVFGPLGINLSAGTVPNAPSADTLANAQALVCVSLERLCGTSRGFNMFPHVQRYLSFLAGAIFRWYKDYASVLILISRFFKDFCDAQVTFLLPQEYMYVCNVVLLLLRSAREVGIGQRKGQGGDTVDDDATILLFLIEILSHLSSKFYFDVSSSGTMSDAEVELVERASTDVLFEGFALLLPVLRGSNRFLYLYMDLSSRFFELLNQSLDVHTDKLASISPDLFSALVDTVHNALLVPSKLIVSNSLDAWYALLKHHVQQGSLEPQLQHNPQLLEHSMNTLMRWALFDDLDVYLVKPLSQCILALLVCSPPLLERFVERLLGERRYQEFHPRIVAAFQTFTRDLKLSIDKESRESFGRGFATFVEELRAFLRKI